jgi:hypothetical protein
MDVFSISSTNSISERRRCIGGNERTIINSEQRRKFDKKQRSIDGNQRGRIERVSRVKVIEP